MSQEVTIEACADCSPVKYKGETTIVCSNPRVLVERCQKREFVRPGLLEVQSTLNLENETRIFDKTESKGKRGTKRTRKEAVPKKSSKAKLSLKKSISSKDLNEALLNPLKDLNETDDFALTLNKPPTKRKQSDYAKSAIGSKKCGEEKNDNQTCVSKEGEIVDSHTDEKYGAPQLQDITEEVKAVLSSDEGSEDRMMCVICNQRMRNELLADHLKECLKQQFKREKKKPGVMAVRPTGSEETDIPMELVLCQICHVDLSDLTPNRQTIHVNNCMDKTYFSPETTTESVGKGEDVILPCPICGKPLKTKTLRTSHIKKCSSMYSVPDYVSENLIQLQNQELEKQLKDASVSSGLTEPKSGSLPLDNNRNTETLKSTSRKGARGQTKKSKKSTKILDEDTEFAMALSTSLIEEQQKQKNILLERLETIDRQAVRCKKSAKDIKKSRKKKAGFSSSPDKLPALLQQTTEEIRRRIAERVGEIITLMDDIPTYNTPPLGSSSLGNKFLQGASNFRKSTCEEGPNLWKKSSMKMGTADMYYVEQLSSHVSVVASKQGTSLSRQASIPGRRRSSEHEKSMTQAGEITIEEESMDVVSTQTAVVLAELASEYNTSFDQSGDLSQSQPSHSFTSMNMSCVQLVNKHSKNNSAIDTKPDTSEDLSCSGFCPEEIDKQEEISAHLFSLRSDLGAMVNNPVFSDFKIRTAEGKTLNGHKMILAARCPCLNQALQLDTELNLEKFSYPVILSVLKFVYSGEIPQTVDTECLHLAKRLGLTELCDILYENKEETELQIGNNSDKVEGDGNIEDLITTFFSGCSDSETDNDDQIVDQIEDEEMDSLYQFMCTQREKSSANKRDNLSRNSTKPTVVKSYQLDSCDNSSDSNNATPVKSKLCDGDIRDSNIENKNSSDSKSGSVSDSESSQQSCDDFKMNENAPSKIVLPDSDLHLSSLDTGIDRKNPNKSSKKGKKRTMNSSDIECKRSIDVSRNKRRRTDVSKINKTSEAVDVSIHEKNTSSASSYSENTENPFKEVHSMLNELSPGVNITKSEWPNIASDGSEITLNNNQSSSMDSSPGIESIEQDINSEDSIELSEREIELVETSENNVEKPYFVTLLDKSTGTLLCRTGEKSLIVTPQFKLSVLKHKTNLTQSEEKKSKMNPVNQTQTKSTEEKNTSSSNSESQSKVQNDTSLNTSDSWLIPDTPAKTPSFTSAKSFSAIDRTKSAQRKSLKNSEKKICTEQSTESTDLLETCPETSTDTYCTQSESIDFKNLSKYQPSFSKAVVSTPVSNQSRKNLFRNQKFVKSLNSTFDNDDCSIIENVSPERSQNSSDSLDLRMEESKELSAQTKLQTSESNSSDQDSEVEILTDNFEKSLSPKFPRRTRQSQSKSDSQTSHDNTKDLTEDQIKHLLKDVDAFFGKSPSTSRVNISNKLKSPALAPTDMDRQSKSSNHESGDELPEISSSQFNNSQQSFQTSVMIEADIHHSSYEDNKQVNQSHVKEKKKVGRKFTFKKLINKPSHVGTCIQQNDEITLMSSQISYSKPHRSSRKKTKSSAPYSPPSIMDLSAPELSCTSLSDDNAPDLINQNDEKLSESNYGKDNADEVSDPETVEDVWADFDDAGVEFNPGLCNSPEQTSDTRDSSATEVIEGPGECSDHAESLDSASVEMNSPPHPSTPPHAISPHTNPPYSSVTPQDCRQTGSAITSPEFNSPLEEVNYLDQFDDLHDSFQCPQNTTQVEESCKEITKRPLEITKTPKCPKRTKPKKKWVPPSPFTPIPEYDKMNTPGLKKEMHKYGIKAVSKKRMVVCLKDIYHQTHQYETDSEAEITIIEDDGRIQMLGTKNNQTKQILDHGNKNKGKKTQLVKKSAPSLLQKLQSKSVSSKKIAESCNGGDVVHLSAENESDEDGDSSASDVLEESLMIDAEDMPYSQQDSNPNLQQELHKFFTSDSSLYCRVLMYECIMFTMKNTANRQRGRQKKGKKTATKQ